MGDMSKKKMLGTFSFFCQKNSTEKYFFSDFLFIGELVFCCENVFFSHIKTLFHSVLHVIFFPENNLKNNNKSNTWNLDMKKKHVS